MVGYNMGTVESYFADIVWEREPLSTSELIEICKEKFNWKRTTTYTVLKRLCEGGVFKLENSTVTSLRPTTSRRMQGSSGTAIQSTRLPYNWMRGSPLPEHH